MVLPPTESQLASWYDRGEFKLENAHCNAFGPGEQEAVARVFHRHADARAGEEARLHRTAFIGLLQARLPPGLPSTFAETLYRLVAYHAAAPFYPSPSSTPPPSLGLRDLERGLAWLLPPYYLHVSTKGTPGRLRTPSDQRRVVFQSIATCAAATADNAGEEAVRCDYARRGAYDEAHVRENVPDFGELIEELLDTYAKMNRDADGDETFHDLVDVLQMAAPVQHPYGVKRDQLRPLAKKLHVADVPFHRLAIAREELRDLVKVLVALQYEVTRTSQEPIHLTPFEEAVACVMATFTCDDEQLAAAFPIALDLVAWPAFDKGLQKMTRLLYPAYTTLVEALLDGQDHALDLYTAEDVPQELRREDPDDAHVLSLGFMTLAEMAFPVLDWLEVSLPRTVLRWRRDKRSPVPSADALWQHLKSAHPSILAFHGCVKGSGERVVGGVLASFHSGNEGQDPQYTAYPFRVAPSVHWAKLSDSRWVPGPQEGYLGLGTPSSTVYGLRFDTRSGLPEIQLPEVAGKTIELDALEVWHGDTILVSEDEA